MWVLKSWAGLGKPSGPGKTEWQGRQAISRDDVKDVVCVQKGELQLSVLTLGKLQMSMSMRPLHFYYVKTLYVSISTGLISGLFLCQQLVKPKQKTT